MDTKKYHAEQRRLLSTKKYSKICFERSMGNYCKKCRNFSQNEIRTVDHNHSKKALKMVW